MTVWNLIKKLGKYPPTAKVMLYNDEFGSLFSPTSVRRRRVQELEQLDSNRTVFSSDIRCTGEFGWEKKGRQKTAVLIR